MTGLESAAGAAAIEASFAIVERMAPTGINLIKSWLQSKVILVVGQSRAGKTTFIDYLHYGLFEDEKETERTKREIGTARFDVKMGRDAALEVSVKKVIDIAGQIGPTAHADLVLKYRPHVIIILTDLTTPVDIQGESDRTSGAWLLEFCNHLEAAWRVKGGKGNRTKSMIVIMNKRDKVNAQELIDRRIQFRKILDTELREARGRTLNEIAIMPCTLVSNPNGTKEVDSVIAHFAKALAQKQ